MVVAALDVLWQRDGMPVKYMTCLMYIVKCWQALVIIHHALLHGASWIDMQLSDL